MSRKLSPKLDSVAKLTQYSIYNSIMSVPNVYSMTHVSHRRRDN